jgi:hypothetical protein
VSEYSRSRKAMETTEGGNRGEEDRKSKEVIGRALMVCRHSLILEHVAMIPWEFKNKHHQVKW